ncbi:MAG: tetratricopeptide repeat protein [Acidobacteriota bacterium]
MQRLLLSTILTSFFSVALAAVEDSRPSPTAALQQLTGRARAAEQRQDYAGAAAAYEELTRLRPKDAGFHQSAGLAWYLHGSYAKSIAFLERALTLDPKRWAARLYLGICYYRTNQFRKAVASLKLVERAKPAEAMALYWLGASHLALKDFAQATSKLQQATTLAPSDPEVWHTLAKTYAGYAGLLFEQLVQNTPDSGPAKLVRAEDLWDENLTQPALELLSEAMEADRRLTGLHLLSGEILWQERKFQEAAAEFEKELVLDPASPPAHERLAAYYQTNDSPARAKAHLEYLARLRPQEPTSVTSRPPAPGVSPEERRDSDWKLPRSAPEPEVALAHYARGEIAEAITLLRSQVKSTADDLEARRWLARCLVVDEQYSVAASELQEFLKIRPDDPEARYWLAKTYQALTSQAVQKATALEPGSYRVLLLQGEALEKSVRREYSEALAKYLEALALRPEAPGVAFAVGRILWKLNRFDEAVSYLEKELALNSHHGLANYYLGNIHLSRADSGKALIHLDAAIQAQPGLIQAHRDRGRALASLKRYGEAIDAFQIVARATPQDSSIHVLMATAYRAMGKLEEARQAALTAQQLSEKRRRLPGE